MAVEGEFGPDPPLCRRRWCYAWWPTSPLIGIKIVAVLPLDEMGWSGFFPLTTTKETQVTDPTQLFSGRTLNQMKMNTTAAIRKPNETK